MRTRGNGTAPEKRCPYCGSVIPAEVSVCPFCAMSLTWWAQWNVVVPIVLLVGAVVVALWLWW